MDMCFDLVEMHGIPVYGDPVILHCFNADDVNYI